MFRRELIERILKNGCKVIIAAPYGEKIDYFISLGCTFIDTPLERRGTNPLADFKLLLSYKDIIEEFGPNIVLTYTVKPNIYGGIACRMTGAPYIANITGLGTSVSNGGFLRMLVLFLYKKALKEAACVFFQNGQNREVLEKNRIIGNNSKIIPGSGVNLAEHALEDYPEDDGTIRFLFLGRIKREKGVGELLEAACRIARQYPEVIFELIGFEEDSGFAVKLDELERAGVIKYSGNRGDVHSFIKKCHCTVLPSYTEGMSNALLESASTGRPVLASKIPGCAEAFDEGVSGFGFETQNVDDLTDKLIKFIRLPYEHKKAMGIAGRRKMEREFDRNIVVDAYMEKIEEAVGESSGGEGA